MPKIKKSPQERAIKYLTKLVTSIFGQNGHFDKTEAVTFLEGIFEELDLDIAAAYAAASKRVLTEKVDEEIKMHREKLEVLESLRVPPPQ